MDFIHGDSIALGKCTNLSESGLRGNFAEPLQPGTEGLLTLYHRDRRFALNARIDRVAEDETRIHFQLKSDKERVALGVFVKSLATDKAP